jgi:LemA protein
MNEPKSINNKTSQAKDMVSATTDKLSTISPKKKAWGIVAILAVVLLTWMVTGYNSLLGLSEEVDAKFGAIQSQYQRRADLIPNLIESVKGAAENEKGILEAVTNARAGLTKAKADIDSATTPDQLDAAGTEISTINSGFRVQVEAYPTITSTQAFLDFQAELTGTENRIAVARQDYNETIKDYNKKAKRFPTVILAKLFNYDSKTGFRANAGTENAPKVEF